MRSNSVTAAIRFLLYFVTLRSLAWSSRSREHALTRLTRAEGADGHGDGAGNVTLHRSDSLHSTSHVAEPAEGSVRPHPLLAGELIDHSLSQQQNRRHRLIIKRNLTGEQGKSTTTPGTSPRRNSNQRNLDPEKPPARRTSEQQGNLTASQGQA